MKFSELKSNIEELSNKYSVVAERERSLISYKEKNVIYISNIDQFIFISGIRESVPFSHKAYMLAAEYAMTPLNEREDEKRYYLPLKRTLSLANLFISNTGDVIRSPRFEKCEYLKVSQREIDSINGAFSFDLNELKVEVPND